MIYSTLFFSKLQANFNKFINAKISLPIRIDRFLQINDILLTREQACTSDQFSQIESILLTSSVLIIPFLFSSQTLYISSSFSFEMLFITTILQKYKLQFSFRILCTILRQYFHREFKTLLFGNFVDANLNIDLYLISLIFIIINCFMVLFTSYAFCILRKQTVRTNSKTIVFSPFATQLVNGVFYIVIIYCLYTYSRLALSTKQMKLIFYTQFDILNYSIECFFQNFLFEIVFTYILCQHLSKLYKILLVFMINKIVILFLIALLSPLVLTVTQGYKFNDLHLIKVMRTISCNGKYPTQVIAIKLKSSSSQGASYFEHVTTKDIDEKLVKIQFSSDKQNTNILSFDKKMIQTQKGKQLYVYKVDLKSPLIKDEEDTLYIHQIFINRYENLPETIKMTEQQMLVYEDYRYFFTPYLVDEQTAVYKFQRLVQIPSDAQKKGLAGVSVKGTNIQPFTDQTHRIHGVNNDPQVIFTQVQKIIDVSHWGNIAITQFYKVKNVGPGLKGQFSKVQYGSQTYKHMKNDAKNAFFGIKTSLPYQIWGLYYRDQVGNISTSKAYRDHTQKKVQFAVAPRFDLLGGWKCNWQIGYNLNTDKLLKRENDHYELQNIEATYAFSEILAQKYTIKVILPEGSSNVSINVNSKQVEPSSTSLTFSYLDFEGKPAFTLLNQRSLAQGAKLTVQYELQMLYVIRKPLIIFGIFFSLLLFTIIINRIKLEAFEDHTAKKQ